MAKLHRVDPMTDPGITRKGAGTGFTYAGPRGGKVSEADLARIKAHALPPAWTDVWICTDPLGHIQAVGKDEAGRQQYRYHELWQEERAQDKFDRILKLAQALPAARGRATRDLNGDDAQSRVLAVAFRFLDDAAPRIGSIAYLERYGSRGLTTLEQRDATVDGHRIRLRFPAKSHKTDELEMTDEVLASVVAALQNGSASDRLLRYKISGRYHHIDPEEVNGYLHELTGGPYTAKDFRTLRGTIAAAESLAKADPAENDRAMKQVEVAAIKAAAEALQNTPAVARSSYVDPRIFDAFRAGKVIELGVSGDGALLRLLGGDAQH